VQLGRKAFSRGAAQDRYGLFIEEKGPGGGCMPPDRLYDCLVDLAIPFNKSFIGLQREREPLDRKCCELEPLKARSTGPSPNVLHDDVVLKYAVLEFRL